MKKNRSEITHAVRREYRKHLNGSFGVAQDGDYLYKQDREMFDLSLIEWMAES